KDPFYSFPVAAERRQGAGEKVFRRTRIPQFNCMTCAGRGVSLEQRTHRSGMVQFFCYLALRSQRLRTPLIAPMPATALRGTGLLRSLRKACALSCASPSTTESGLNGRFRPWRQVSAALGAVL